MHHYMYIHVYRFRIYTHSIDYVVYANAIYMYTCIYEMSVSLAVCVCNGDEAIHTS